MYYEEEWDLTESDILSIFPIEKIERCIGENPNFEVLFDDDILRKDAEAYNLSIFTRAFNQDIPEEKLCRKNLHNIYDLMEDISLRDVVHIRLPQAIIFDTLGYDEVVMSLHFSKLRSDELYINDFVMMKNPNTFLKNNIASEVMENLKKLAKTKNIRYISGYAMNEVVFQIFKNYGFKDDMRAEYGNDWLMSIAMQTKCQYPFYIDLKEI